MGKECFVFGCTNRDTHKKEGIKFHRIPKDEPRRSLWIRAINRKDESTGKYWIPGDEGARICSDHFFQGKCDDSNSPDYVPNIKMGYGADESASSSSVHRYKRAFNRSTNKKEMDVRRQLDFGMILTEDKENSPVPLKEISGENENTTINAHLHDSCLKMFEHALNENSKLLQQLQQLQIENREFKSPRSYMKADHLSMEKSDENTTFYTGLPSYSCFLWLVSFVSSVLPISKLLSSADILLLVLMKLRLNVPHTDLAFRFGISLSLVTTLIDSTIPQLAQKLKWLIHWPNKDDILRCRPDYFKEAFPKCVSTIDCTEVYIETPSNYNARSQTYSNYKHHHTLKFLVSIVPCGSISFISQAFGGRTSDKLITLKSGYLDFIHHGDVVLADRGFLIHDELASRGAELVIPAFAKGNDQFSARDVEKSRSIAHVRIHVEREMMRLKYFRILSGKMSLNMVPHSDSIMTICGAIVNMHPNRVQCVIFVMFVLALFVKNIFSLYSVKV